MNDRNESLQNLADQAAQGDERAKIALQSALERQLARIVRRALDKGQSSSSLTRKIAATARRLDPDSFSPADPLRVGMVADNLGKTIINRLWGATEQFGPPSTRIA